MWQTGRHILMARSEDIRRPRTTSGHRNDVAASETPHGASLHWGESAVVEDKLTPMGVRAQHVYWYVTTSKPATSPPGRFTLFESGQVRPLALSPDRPPDRSRRAGQPMAGRVLLQKLPARLILLGRDPHGEAVCVVATGGTEVGFGIGKHSGIGTANTTRDAEKDAVTGPKGP